MEQLKKYRDDCEAKLAALVERIKAEEASAREMGHEACEIIPLTEADPKVLGPVLDAMVNVPKELSESVGALRKVCRHQSSQFCMRSDQLLAILKAANATKKE